MVTWVAATPVSLLRRIWTNGALWIVKPDSVTPDDCWKLIIFGAFECCAYPPALAAPASDHHVVPLLGPPVSGDQPWPSIVPGPPTPALVVLQEFRNATQPVSFASRVPQTGIAPEESQGCVREVALR